jgi:superoxide reductase
MAGREKTGNTGREQEMNRREFMKGVLLTGTILVSEKALAGEYKYSGKEKLNKLTDKDSPSVMEQKHVPGVETPGSAAKGNWFDVKVKVGFMKEHPSTPGHWITMIKLLVDGKEVARTDFIEGGDQRTRKDNSLLNRILFHGRRCPLFVVR